MDSKVINLDSQVHNAWKLFITKGMIRREILRECVAISWARCRLSNIDYENFKQNEVIVIKNDTYSNYDHDRMNKDLEKCVPRTYRDRIDYMVLDRDSVVVTCSFKDEQSPFKNIRIGSQLDENMLGNMSYQLIKDDVRLAIIIGCEHYHRQLHTYVDFSYRITLGDTDGIVMFMMPIFDYHSNIFEEFAYATKGFRLKFYDLEQPLTLQDNFKYQSNQVVSQNENISIDARKEVVESEIISFILNSDEGMLYPICKLSEMIEKKKNEILRDLIPLIPQKYNLSSKTYNVILNSLSETYPCKIECTPIDSNCTYLSIHIGNENTSYEVCSNNAPDLILESSKIDIFVEIKCKQVKVDEIVKILDYLIELSKEKKIILIHIYNLNDYKDPVLYEKLKTLSESLMRYASEESKIMIVSEVEVSDKALETGNCVTVTQEQLDSIIGESTENLVLPTRLEDIEVYAIKQVLQRTQYNYTQAAKELGISRSTLYRKCEKFGI